METGRRGFVGGGLIAALLGASGAGAATKSASPGYGLIGLMRAQPGKRDDLIAILRAGTNAMPGCVAYLINPDARDATGIWITEVWDGKASHDASLTLPAVRETIRRGRPLIAGFDVSLEATAKG